MRGYEDASRRCGDQEILTNGQLDSFRPWQWPWLHLKKARVANRRSQGCAELGPTRTVRKSPWAGAVAGGGGLHGLWQNDDTRRGLGWPCVYSSQSPSRLHMHAVAMAGFVRFVTLLCMEPGTMSWTVSTVYVHSPK